MISKALFLVPSLLVGVLCRSIVLPPPPDSANVHITHFPITDVHRVDPFAPCCNQPRRLMLSLYQPTSCSQTKDIPYMPPQTAAICDDLITTAGFPNGAFSPLRLRTCPRRPKNNAFPLLVFSPGWDFSRYAWGNLLQWIASTGFNIISIDHTYDANIVEFPDGTLIPGQNLTTDQFFAELPELLEVRLADVSTVLDALANATNTKSLGLPTLRTDRVGIFGHSLGGTTVADAMLVESRIAGGISMEGGAYQNATKHDNNLPFLIFNAEGHNQTSDSTLEQLWSHLKGTKLQLEVNHTGHGAFADFPIVAKSIGFEVNTVPLAQEYVGTIDGTRMLTILRSYVSGFFQKVLEGKQVELLEGPCPDFPEVVFANMSTASQACL